MLDVDYHHGNGTQTIFYERSDVMFLSIHGDPRTEYPFFLGHADETGSGEGLGYNKNYPLPAGSSNALWFDALGDAVRRINEFKPDALVISLGVDTFADDPISKFQLREPEYLKLGAQIAALEAADRVHSRRRLCRRRDRPQRRACPARFDDAA